MQPPPPVSSPLSLGRFFILARLMMSSEFTVNCRAAQVSYRYNPRWNVTFPYIPVESSPPFPSLHRYKPPLISTTSSHPNSTALYDKKSQIFVSSTFFFYPVTRAMRKLTVGRKPNSSRVIYGDSISIPYPKMWVICRGAIKVVTEEVWRLVGLNE